MGWVELELVNRRSQHSSTARRGPALCYTSKQSKGSPLPPPIRITGREVASDVCIPHSGVSDPHAELTCVEGGVVLIKVGALFWPVGGGWLVEPDPADVQIDRPSNDMYG